MVKIEKKSIFRVKVFDRLEFCEKLGEKWSEKSNAETVKSFTRGRFLTLRWCQ